MRGRRLVSTEHVVAVVAEGGDAALDTLRGWADGRDLELTVVPVGGRLDGDVPSGRTVGVTIGGDGTYLEGINRFAPREIPVLGVDTGTSPFLARVAPADLPAVMDEVIEGRAVIESRSQLRVRVGGMEETGLNDVTLQHVPPDRPVDRKVTDFRAFFGDEYVGSFVGTGLTVATATGSTGIALSAGGPIHYPRNNRTLQLTPLLIHDLSARPIVVDEGVPIALQADREVDLTIDGGRHHRRVDADQTVRVDVAVESADVIRPSHESGFFEALSDRLGWNLGMRDPPEPPMESPAGTTADDGLSRARAIAEEAAQSVGSPLRELHGRTETVEYKSDKYDLVTEADYQSESILCSILESEYPDHNIHSEEDVRRDTGSRYTWLVDPLDGTGNYANGNPNYAVSIALVREETPVVGVVYAPETNELFSATNEGPAMRNGKPVSTTDRDRLDESVFMSGYDPEGTFLTHFYNVTRGVRRLGAVSLHLCYLAAGSCDATWEYDTIPWDTAAGVVIARAAGATITDATGEPFDIYGDDDGRNELLGSNGPLHAAVLAHLRRHEQLGEL